MFVLFDVRSSFVDIAVLFICQLLYHSKIIRGGGRDRMVAGFTTIYALSAYHH